MTDVAGSAGQSEHVHDAEAAQPEAAATAHLVQEPHDGPRHVPGSWCHAPQLLTARCNGPHDGAAAG